MKILIVCAHPDDELLGAGGTGHKHVRKGDQVLTLILSQGRNDPIDQKFDNLPIKDFITTIEQTVQAFKPKIIYTHFGKDLNKDHQIIHEAVKVACRPFKSSVKAIYGFDSTFSLFDTFAPCRYVTLDERDMEWKIDQMISKYPEETDLPYRTKKGITIQAKYWGMKINKKFAEAYEVISEII